MKRLAALACTLLACQSAFAIAVENFSYQSSVAVGHTTLVGVFFRIIDDAGLGVAGVAYTHTVDGSCATFEDGSTSFSGVSDEFGLGASPPLIGHILTAACNAAFIADGLAEPIPAPLFVFNPADVVLTTSPAAFANVPLCRSWKIAVYAKVGGIVVYPHTPVEVSITAGSNGATGTIDEVQPPLVSGGPTGVIFTSNDKQGHYELQARYGAAFVAMPVDQKKFKGDCVFF